MILPSARKHLVGVLSLFWIASFGATVLPELHRNYQDILIGRAGADPIVSAPGVILVGLALGLGPPALLAAIAALITRRAVSRSDEAARTDGRRRSDAQNA